jgi:amino acid adenylation domain-containing protein
MSGMELLAELTSKGVDFWYEGDRLRFRAPKGAFNGEQRARVADFRDEIVAHLRARAELACKTTPLSFSQRSLWYIHQQEPTSAAYNVAFVARVASLVDVSALRQALQALIDRHGALRTTFAVVDGVPLQRVAGSATLALDTHAVTELGEHELRERVRADYRRPFDLEAGPLFRSALYTTAPKQHVLLLVMHHIVADGWSLMQLLDEMRALHLEATGGPAASLPRLEIDYTDYTEWQARMLAGTDGDRLAAYWQRQLAAPREQVEVPTDRERPSRRNVRGATFAFDLDPAHNEGLRRLAREEATTLFVVLLAAFKTLLFRCSGCHDLVVGTPTFGRSKPEFARVVGDFVNTVALRTRLDATLPFRELLDRLKQTLLDALDAQDYPLPMLVERLAPVRGASRSPLFDVLFSLQRFDQLKELDPVLAPRRADDAVDFGGMRLQHFPLDQQEGQFDLSLQVFDRGHSLTAQFKYDANLYDRASIERLSEKYRALIANLLAVPATPVGALNLETAAKGDAADVGELNDRPAQMLLEGLRKRDIRLVLDGGKLRVNAPKGALDEALKALISRRKQELISALGEGARSAATPAPISCAQRMPPLPLSPAQQRLWFLDRIDPGHAHYNVPMSLRLHGRAELPAMKRALDEIVRRHEVLRLAVGERDGEPYATMGKCHDSVVRFVGLSHLPLAQREPEALRLAASLVREPFDLSSGRLAAFQIVRLEPDDHVLTLCMHHIAADGWSLAVALREFTSLYAAFAAGLEPALEPLRLQYVDYAAWQRSQLSDRRLHQGLDYWRKTLAGAPAVLDLPTDRPRPATQALEGRRLRRDIDPSLLEALKAFSRKHDVTLFMTLLAAWQVLLHRYSGQDDIVVGTPVANRDRPELEQLIGCFVDNVALRGRLGGNPVFVDYLTQAKTTTLDAFEHSNIPFEVLVEALHPDRSGGHPPIFQVLLTLYSFWTDEALRSGPWTMQPLETDTGAARFDITLDLAELQGRLVASYEYATALFDDSTIERMHAAFTCLLNGIVADPHRRVLELPLLPPVDAALLSTWWNDTVVVHDRSRCVHHLLEATAEATPDAIAVHSNGSATTYGKLDERANRLAHLLMLHGVARGSLVAVCVDRTLDMPTAIAAVLKAGAAYVPLDPAHPAERLKYMVQDAGVACAITLSEFAGALADAGVPLLLLDTLGKQLETLPSTPVEVAVCADDLAYVIYTSGSTGRPKGVQVEHRNVVSFLEAMRRAPGFSTTDALLAVTTLSFDIAGLELWLPLSVGGRVVIASRTDVLDGRRLIRLLDQHRITVMQATPATWRLMLEAGWTGSPDLRVLCGGEALPRDLAALLLARVGSLWNMYGPTETTIWSTVGRVTDASASIPIGRPIANTRIFVIEPGGQLAPIGVPGELCIAGEGVARGYRDRPELTAEKFVELLLPDSQGGERTERVYRTGDMARFRHDGQIEFIGRRDQQVKVRGYRIELGEIEAVLAAHPGIKECAVAVREDSPGDARIVAYVVTELGAPFGDEAAIATMRQRLPEYMVPRTFVQLPALPLTPNGKIDRKALPAPAKPVVTGSTSDALMTPTQRRIATIWRQVLRLDRVGLHDNFFDVGGHSLLLVRLQLALRGDFGIELPLVEFLQFTTIASQAERLSKASGSSAMVQQGQARAARLSHA